MVTTSEKRAVPPVHMLIDQIVEWLRDRITESNAHRFVLALSGGIDSAVVCALCTRAVGPERVLCVIMPSNSNPDDAECARLVAETFAVPTLTVDLTDFADTFYRLMPSHETLQSAIGQREGQSWQDNQQLATANVRPRLRMTTLYYLANLCSGIVVGTGNKSEAAVGYFTKYGDGGVDLFPIIDLYKSEVRVVAEELGVPQRVIKRPPSAGLWLGQTDEAELGMTYEQLDETLLAIERGDTSSIDQATLNKIRGMVDASEHKRQPVPTFRRAGPAA